MWGGGAREFPRFGVLPADVDRMIEVEQEAFTTVEETKPHDVVVEERRERIEDDVPDKTEGAAADLSSGDGEAGHLVAVAAHVLEVEWQGGVGVVEEVALNAPGGTVVEGRAMGTGFVGHPRGTATEEAHLTVRVEAAVAHPAAKYLVPAVYPVGAVGRMAGKQFADVLLERSGKNLICVQQEDPVGGALVDGRVFLATVTFEGLDEDLGVVSAGDLECAVGGEGVDDDDLVGEAHGVEGARKIGLLVHRDHGDGEGHGRLGRERDGRVVELLAEQPFGEGKKVFAGLREGERLVGFAPFQFVGRRESGDPYLANRSVRGEDELRCTVFEEDVEDAVLLLGLEASFFFSAEEGLLERFESFVGLVAEGRFVDHVETSVIAPKGSQFF